MTRSRCHSARGFLGATLLVATLSVAAGPECLAEDFGKTEVQTVQEPPADDPHEILDQKPLLWVSDSSNPLDFETTAATLLGGLGGVYPGLLAGAGSCILLCWFVHDSVEFQELYGWGAAGSLVGAILGGYLGYQNSPVLIAGGVFAGTLVGALGPAAGGSELWVGAGAVAGGGLGYALWSSRLERFQQVSIFPYRDQEGSGVMLSGRF